jgi:cyclopropane fatty-acyl-phospholipid synthase-like methyltransferase
MLELISPKEISRESSLIKNFKNFGIDFLDLDYPLGWNYALDHIWLYKKIRKYIQEKGLTQPIILDVGCGNSPFHNFLEKKLDVSVIGVDRPEGFCHQKELKNVDHFVEFKKFKEYPNNSVDIIYWLSAIEHNKKSEIKKLYKKSMQLLKPDGLLLITFPVSRITSWFEDSQQTNFSIKKATKVFKEKNVSGDYDQIHKEFRKDFLYLRKKYENRYGHFSDDDPLFIVGGLEQRKK